MSTRLELNAVQKHYGSVAALQELSLTIEPGEFVTLLGPSGSGKTTALKLIAGFEQPSAGEIRLDGCSIVNLPPYRRDIGMVFQNYALFPHMTVRENLAFPLAVRKAPRTQIAQKVKAALELVRMEEYGARFPRELSGGQQQRIALARAIAFGPRILLMDEPLGALDRNLREHLKSEIMHIQKNLGVTVVFVTHDQDEALTMSHRIAIMRGGRLVQIGDSRTLYYRPQDRFVAQFLGESNLLECRVHSIERNDACVTLRNGMRVDAQLVARASPGDAACLFIRPEHLVLSPRAEPAQGNATVHGRVRQSAFLGESTRYDVDCGELGFTVKQQNRDGSAYPVGSIVNVSWHTQAALVLT